MPDTLGGSYQRHAHPTQKAPVLPPAHSQTHSQRPKRNAHTHLGLLRLALHQPHALVLGRLRLGQLPQHRLRLRVGVCQLLLQLLVDQAAAGDPTLVTNMRLGSLKLPVAVSGS